MDRVLLVEAGRLLVVHGPDEVAMVDVELLDLVPAPAVVRNLCSVQHDTAGQLDQRGVPRLALRADREAPPAEG